MDAEKLTGSLNLLRGLRASGREIPLDLRVMVTVACHPYLALPIGNKEADIVRQIMQELG